MQNQQKNITRLLIMVLAAVAAFVPLFAVMPTHTFFRWMVVVVTALCLLGATAVPHYLPEIFAVRGQPWGKILLLGFGSAVILYFIFFSGHHLSRMLLRPAAAQVEDVYTLKHGRNPLLLIPLLVIIGGGEEIFWRGMLQNHWSAISGLTKGFLLTAALYAAVHLSSGNVMLTIAAAVCGSFWGFMYLKYRLFWANMISHIVWDLAVFIFFPFY